MKDDSILESVFTESWINESNENYSIDDKYITLESLLLDFEEYDNIATDGTKVKSDANQLKYAKKAIKIIQKFVYSRLQDFRAIYSLFTSMVISACGNYATAMRF